MWSAARTILHDGRGEKVALLQDGTAVSFAQVIVAWRENAAFRDFFIGELARVPFPAFFWEMPPIRRDTTGRFYEFVTVRSDALARMSAEPGAFASKFNDRTGSVATFRNLGGDAMLVAPRPDSGSATCTHLAAFLRTAPEAQQHALFTALARAMDEELRRSPARIWVSTSGLGVGWLHIRLDSFPKYYQHRPYADDS